MTLEEFETLKIHEDFTGSVCYAGHTRNYECFRSLSLRREIVVTISEGVYKDYDYRSVQLPVKGLYLKPNHGRSKAECERLLGAKIAQPTWLRSLEENLIILNDPKVSLTLSVILVSEDTWKNLGYKEVSFK